MKASYIINSYIINESIYNKWKIFIYNKWKYIINEINEKKKKKWNIINESIISIMSYQYSPSLLSKWIL